MRVNKYLLDPLVETQGGAGEGLTAVAPEVNPFQTAPETGNAAVMPPVDWDKEKIEIDDFLGKGEQKIPEPQSKEAGKVETKVETTDDEPVVTPVVAEGEQQQQQVETKVEGEQQPVVKDPLAERFPEATVFTKQMSKPAREYFAARLNEILVKEQAINERDEALKLAQQGRTKVPESYYENPYAFTLLPEYHSAAFNVTLAQKVEAHWAEQHRKIANGENWNDIEEVYDKAGNLIDVKPSKTMYKPDGDGQHHVFRYLNHAERQMEKLVAERDQIARSFQQTHQQRVGKLQEVEKELFNPQRWDAKDTAESKTLEGVRAGLRDLGVAETNPLYNLLAKTGAALIMERQWRQAQMKKVDTQKAIAADVKKAGPTGSATVGGGGKKVASGDDITIDDFTSLLTPSRY